MGDFFIPTSILALTLKVAGLATVVAAVFGVGAGWVLAKKHWWGSNGVDVLLTLPLVLPPTVLGYYLLVLFGRNGAIGQWLTATIGWTPVFTWQGAVLAAAVVAFPLVYKSSRAAFDAVDSNLENAARTLGVSELGIFFRISLPLAMRGVLAGAMLAFARAMGEFGATMMVAGNLPGRTQTLSLAVYSAVQAGSDSQADALVWTASLVCAVILYGAGRLVGRSVKGV